MSLYGELVLSGCTMDSHESDLYVERTPVSELIVERYLGKGVKTFRNQNDGEVWFDIPFGYIPFWEARTEARK